MYTIKFGLCFFFAYSDYYVININNNISMDIPQSKTCKTLFSYICTKPLVLRRKHANMQLK